MDNTEAKFILQAYRPGGHDADAPEFAAALAQAGRDPELAAWFKEEQALDAAIAARLAAVPVPANLKENILAGRKVVRVPAFWQRGRLLALAAAIAVLLSLGAFWWSGHKSSAGQFAAYRADMGRFLDNIDHLELQTDDLSKIRHWLGSRQGPSDFVLPPKLEGKPSMGCRVVNWHGQKVTLVCYYLEPTGGEKLDELHLLVMDRSALQDPPPAFQPQFAALGRWEAATWSDERHTYLLAGLSKGHYLKNYLAE